MLGQGTQCTAVVLQSLIRCQISAVHPVSFFLLAGEVHGQILCLRTLKVWHCCSLMLVHIILHCDFFDLYSRICWSDFLGLRLWYSQCFLALSKNEELNAASLGRCGVSYLSCLGHTEHLCSVSPVMVRTSSQDQVQGSYRLHVWSWCNSWAMGNLKIWFWTSWNSTAESFESHVSSLNYFKVCCKGVSSISPNICNLKCVFFSQIFLQSCPLPRKLIGPWTQ